MINGTASAADLATILQSLGEPAGLTMPGEPAHALHRVLSELQRLQPMQAARVLAHAAEELGVAANVRARLPIEARP